MEMKLNHTVNFRYNHEHKKLFLVGCNSLCIVYRGLFDQSNLVPHMNIYDIQPMFFI